VKGELVAFIDDMARRYAEADLVICRAGAVTVAELSAGGMASILVPFPHAVDDHQTANGKFLADHGAALLIQQRDLTPQKLAQMIPGAWIEAGCSRWRAKRARSASPMQRAWLPNVA
jgi:UDP-N-acetylglucosamine--N-acetylmuramyl-(pentapeptide) pyrophosphoryl-undecaprenol N-acetylglucosamine transferase